MAVTISDLVGTWEMVHDDWRGTLVINPPDQRHIGIEGSCTYATWVIDGEWTGTSGSSHFVRGHFQGKDTNSRRSELCKDSDHIIKFTIAFDARNPQPFEGYLFTWNKQTMAGYTWWNGYTFGWFARKKK